MEIERKFLVRNEPPVISDAGGRIRQGYVCIGADGREVRIRDRSGTFTLTVKSGGGLTRDEIEVGITQDTFETLWPATLGHRVEKRRYSIPFSGHCIELDVYEGALGGLITAEVEFANLKDATEFEPPAWFDAEVTEDPDYKNAALAC